MYHFLFSFWLVSMIVFLLVVGGGQLLRAGGDLTLRQWHHGYLGAALFGIGALLRLLAGHASGWSLGFEVAGAVLTEDDALEHLTQAVTGQFTYQGPLHAIFYAIFGKLGWVRQAGATLDGAAKSL